MIRTEKTAEMNEQRGNAMILLSQILKDLADDCRMQPRTFETIWNRILQALKQKRLQDKNGSG